MLNDLGTRGKRGRRYHTTKNLFTIAPQKITNPGHYLGTLFMLFLRQRSLELWEQRFLMVFLCDLPFSGSVYRGSIDQISF